MKPLQSIQPRRIAVVDLASATALCSRNRQDCVFWHVEEARRGYYVSTVRRTLPDEHIIDLFDDDGPYPTEHDAYEAGLFIAFKVFEQTGVRAFQPSKTAVERHNTELRRLKRLERRQGVPYDYDPLRTS